MQASTQSKSSYRFGLFELDLASRKLSRKGEPVRLQELPFRLLTILLERAGKIVPREELRQALWPEGTYVEFDGSLNAALKKLRFALGDDADNPTFIQTVPRRGYRFIAPLQSESSAVGAVAIAQPATQSPPTEEVVSALAPSRRLPRWTWGAVVAAVALASFLGSRYAARNARVFTPQRKVIAVLPFANEGAGPELDYLRYAIANDLVTDLTYVPSVTVRPFASTSRYAVQPADPEIVGKELRVTYVIAGGFLRDSRNLRVSLELVDVERNQPIWRGEIAISPHELIALHDKLAERAANGMLPAINISDPAAAAVPSPKNEHAFELFQHSLSIALDPEPNLIAIKKLEQSIALDSSYAPAWGELSRRYGIDYYYGDGGEAALAKWMAADKRRSEIDPNFPAISSTIRAESGDLNGAYDQAADFVQHHPEVASAHGQMSIIFRSAGLLDAANQECDAALALDPGYNGFRFCAMPLIMQGDYARAQTYIRLDESSSFAAMLRMMIALRTGDGAAALTESNAASQGGFGFADLVRIYLNHAPQSELEKAAAELEAEPRAAHDPEMHYFDALALSFTGQTEAAFRQLRKAIAGNYCSYPAMDKDPLFDSIRPRAEFAELRRAAIRCQESFLAHRELLRATMQASHP